MSNRLILGAIVAAALCTPPAIQADTMLGAYVKSDGWSLSAMDEFNLATGKPMAVTNLFTNFDYHWGYLKYQSDNIISRGGVPLISWMPATSTRLNANLLPEIAAGQWDAYIDRWINGFKWWRSGVPAGSHSNIMLRFGHEFNGNWYPWGNDPENFKAAWQHIHDRFEQAGINPYIEWVWCANNADVDSVKDITRYYPGDAYVDWTSLDGYNWGSNYSFSSWKSFDEVFSAPYNKLIDNYPSKPILIAEVGAPEPSDLPNPNYGQNGNDTDRHESKEAWVANMFTRIEESYPAIRAVSWFNINKELNWALDQPNNTGLTAYKATTQSSHYSSTYSPITQ
ncbi:hypothetical protein J9253_10805 [Thiothrix litoralis]|jgi:hypothetical protein|uniref:GH26 domain-containing protein n=1 Tax=Thiothrix litoralis TaxID=2891210 RepID=A0ABX7WN71_9GAMM|nr:glycosyl hydrolase [Thiothrix litoralis]QTR44541.1 hypothetical protein J9253_10805 [Thiothrix litoralis]